MSDIDIQAQIQQNWEAAQAALPSRTIILNAQITDDTAGRLIGHLLLLERLSREPILLVIQSEGGQVYPGLALYDTLRHLTVPLITVAQTLCAGNALLLLLAGHKRYALPNSRLAYTTLRSRISGENSDIIIQGREVQRLQAMHDSIFQQHIATLKHPNALLQLFAVKHPGWDLTVERDLSLQEALDYKLIDAVVDRIEDIARS
jgi:ATP-dependent Clp protease, protease subunit